MAVRRDPYAAYRDRCTSCRAPILWAATDKDVRMPVNPRPAERGNVLLRIEPGQPGRPDRLVAGVLGRGQAAGARQAGQPLHTSHFVDCPRADQHRRRNRP